MNPYILNVSMATRLCSQALCQGRGRCVRKVWDHDVFLHLNPDRYRIQQVPGGPLTVTGSLSQDDIKWFNRSFDCMCYGKEPCRSALTLGVIQSPVTNSNSPGVGLMCCPLLVLVLICLNRVLMLM